MSNIKCFFLEETGKFKESERSCSPLYRRSDTGEITTLEDAPVGAIVRATWMESIESWVGPDGKSYLIKVPGGEWYVDSQASNCNSLCKNCGKPYFEHNQSGFPCRKYVDVRPHKCWCRHGVAPNFTVDKTCPDTCNVGAGSIQTRTYHGFLQNGYLTNC